MALTSSKPVYRDLLISSGKRLDHLVMAFRESLAQRIRAVPLRKNGVAEKKVFGGVGFLLNGNMLVGVWKDILIARLGSEDGERELAEEHVKPLDITGKAMNGWVLVEPDGIESDERLRRWIERAMEFVKGLPRKSHSTASS